MRENPYRDLRKRHKLTQEELAQRLGVSRVTVNKKESGRVKVRTVDKLALRELGRQLDGGLTDA